MPYAEFPRPEILYLTSLALREADHAQTRYFDLFCDETNAPQFSTAAVSLNVATVVKKNNLE